MLDKNSLDAKTKVVGVDVDVEFDGVVYPLDGPDLFAEAIQQVDALAVAIGTVCDG